MYSPFPHGHPQGSHHGAPQPMDLHSMPPFHEFAPPVPFPPPPHMMNHPHAAAHMQAAAMAAATMFGTPGRSSPGKHSNTPIRTAPRGFNQASRTPLTQLKASSVDNAGSAMKTNDKLMSAGGDKRPTGSQLQRDLSLASPEELVQILLDLASCNEAASSFIESKAQLLTLVGSSSPMHPSQQSIDEITSTPAKAESEVTTAEPTPQQLRMTPTPMKTPTSEQFRSELDDRHITPENRPFSREVHPCLHLYGRCRHTTSCLFSRMPANLCMNWVRGQCNNPNCELVHRLPADCPEPLIHIYELNHGGKAPRMHVTPPSSPAVKPVQRCLNDSMAAAETPARKLL